MLACNKILSRTEETFGIASYFVEGFLSISRTFSRAFNLHRFQVLSFVQVLHSTVLQISTEFKYYFL